PITTTWVSSSRWGRSRRWRHGPGRDATPPPDGAPHRRLFAVREPPPPARWRLRGAPIRSQRVSIGCDRRLAHKAARPYTGAPAPRWPARHPLPRPAALLRLAPGGAAGEPADGDGDPRPQPGPPDHEHLRACAPGSAARGARANG